jgi:hypothetical protein
LFRDAELQFGEEGAEATMVKDGETYPEFLNIYPSLHRQQVADDIEKVRRSAGTRRALILSVTPPEHAVDLAKWFREDYPTLNAGAYVWGLEMVDGESGFKWNREAAIQCIHTL